MKQFLLIILFIFALSLINSKKVNAAACTFPTTAFCYEGCTKEGDCQNGKICEGTWIGYDLEIRPGSQACTGSEIILGQVQPPFAIVNYNAQTRVSGGIGILIFVSRIIKLISAVAGILFFGNILYAAFQYITTAGNSQTHSQVSERITFGVVGLVIIAAAYMAAAIIGLVFFGDASFILNPQLQNFGALS